jgi:heme/copper-type cytochrome/quinol oxidase subunit 2
MSHLTAVLAETEAHVELIMPTWAFGAIALGVFAVLGFVIWSYRDVANRHSHKAGPGAADHAAAPGATHHGSGHPSQGH